MPVSASGPIQAFDGHRGENGSGGWWISLTEAKDRSVGRQEWWTQPGAGGRSVSVEQYDPKGPPDKPVWLFRNGDMYLGEWTRRGRQHYPVEMGFGTTYNNCPAKLKGLVYVGEFQDGHCHGLAKTFWLDSAPTWKTNYLPGSPIRQEEEKSGRSISRPFSYVGQFRMGLKWDDSARATLKDGTTRVGKWEEGRPGDWWHDHSSPEQLEDSPSSSRSASPQAVESSDGKRAARAVVSPQETRNATKQKKQRIFKASPLPRPRRTSNKVARPQVLTKRESSKKTQSFTLPTKHETGGAAAHVQPHAPVALEGTQDEKTERVTNLCDWLTTEAIGYNPAKQEMNVYAGKLFDLGLHSAEMVVNVCTPEQVDEFNWMKPFHRQMLKRFLEQG